MVVLVTGCAGFIGSLLTERLLHEGHKVVGIDNFDEYYDSKIKQKNLEDAEKNKSFKLFRVDILNFDKLSQIFEKEKSDKIVHLAAMTGVRPSIADPKLYAKVNVRGTINLLKLSIDFNVKQFIFGSSSSVYGNSKILPFVENNPCNAIISPYGASKRAAEFWVETFYRTYGLKSAILRFFTVYGPRGRPDMAPALFTNAILSNREISKFGDGKSSRDYTYVEDVLNGIVACLNADFDFEIINLGNDLPVTLNEFIGTVESAAGMKAKVNNEQEQIGDVEKTWANVVKANELLNWKPRLNVHEGLAKYVKWLTQRK